ncbi:MAG: tetratricopeptide repeat protein [Pirellulales bacterium]
MKRLLAVFAGCILFLVVGRSSADEPIAVGATPTARTACYVAERARQHLKNWDIDEAVADLQEAISLEPANARHHDRLGAVYLSHCDADKAIAAYTAACDIRRASAERSRELAAAMSVSPPAGSPQDPAASIRRSLIRAYLFRADDRAQEGDGEGARADYNRAIEIDPQDVSTRLARAVFLATQGAFEEALEDCDAAAELDKSSSLAWCARADVLLTKGEPEKAIEVVNQAVALFPGAADAYLARAAIFQKLGKLEEALDDLNEAVGLAPANAMCYYFRSQIYRELKREEEAADDKKKAETHESCGSLSRAEPRC